jgi:hypothetical protein
VSSKPGAGQYDAFMARLSYRFQEHQALVQFRVVMASMVTRNRLTHFTCWITLKF